MNIKWIFLIFFLYIPFEINSMDKEAYVEKNKSMHRAVIAGDYRTVSALLMNGVAVDSFNEDKLTPFYVAVQRKQFVIARMFLSRGARMDVFDQELNSVLHLLAANPDEALMREIRYHAKNKKIWAPLIQHKNKKGQRAQDIVNKDDYPYIYELLTKVS